jgi:hypothetical protein
VSGGWLHVTAFGIPTAAPDDDAPDGAASGPGNRQALGDASPAPHLLAFRVRPHTVLPASALVPGLLLASTASSACGGGGGGARARAVVAAMAGDGAFGGGSPWLHDRWPASDGGAGGGGGAGAAHGGGGAAAAAPPVLMTVPLGPPAQEAAALPACPPPAVVPTRALQVRAGWHVTLTFTSLRLQSHAGAVHITSLRLQSHAGAVHITPHTLSQSYVHRHG